MLHDMPAAAAAPGAMGLDVSALVAGLGLTGLALSDALAGILTLVYRPSRADDRIRVTGNVNRRLTWRRRPE